MPICGACAVEPPIFERARAAIRYDEGARGLILRFKHADRTDIAKTFGQFMEQAGRDLLKDCDIIAPVPLHRWRFLQRGHNQDALLAYALLSPMAASGFRQDPRHGRDRRVIPDLLHRIQSTVSQQSLSRTQRQRNI